MDSLRLEVRRRSLFLDVRSFVFITEEGVEVVKTDTEGVVRHVEKYVNRRLRGAARAHGRAQLLQSLRQYNSPKDGYVQFVVVEKSKAEHLAGLEGKAREVAFNGVVVAALQARLPVDLQSMERWVRGRGLWLGLSGKNQVLGGKARIATEGIVSDFEPEKLLARSLLDKPEAFRGETLRILVVDDPFVNAVTGDGAFLLRATAPRACSRVVSQRVRRCLDYRVRDAKRGETYMQLEFEAKVARHDTEILSIREDGDLLHVEKRERARIDTGAKGPHQQSANLFAGLMRVWSRMAIPCVSVKVNERVVAVRLSDSLHRELLRAGYVEGKDFHGRVDVPHPALVDEAFRKVKQPLVAILEEILTGIEEQGLATRADLKRIRDALETQYGQYPMHDVKDRDLLVAERKATYTAVRRLYGISPVRSQKDVEEIGVRELWTRLVGLSAGAGPCRTTLDRLAAQALAYAARHDRITL